MPRAHEPTPQRRAATAPREKWVTLDRAYPREPNDPNFLDLPPPLDHDDEEPEYGEANPRLDRDDHTAAAARRATERTALLARLRSERETELADKLAGCGSPIFFRCSACHHPHRGEHNCCLKWCPVCARRRAAQRVHKYIAASRLMKWPAHITLTIRNTDFITKDVIDGLKASFRSFRRTRLWADNVKGGVMAVEITNKGSGWHPHLHTLCDVEWLAIETPKCRARNSRDQNHTLCLRAKKELYEAWAARVKQETASVFFRRCDGAAAVIEVLKYAVPAKDLIECEGRIGDLIRAITGTRLTTPYGSLYDLREELKPPPKKPFACPACGELGSLLPEDLLARIETFASARHHGRK